MLNDALLQVRSLNLQRTPLGIPDASTRQRSSILEMNGADSHKLL